MNSMENPVGLSEEIRITLFICKFAYVCKFVCGRLPIIGWIWYNIPVYAREGKGEEIMKRITEGLVSAVIVAAGKGSRMNMDINKQYVDICGVPVLARTLRVFEDCMQVDELILVVNESELIYCKQKIVDMYGFRKIKVLVSGGASRQESVYRGLQQVDPSCAIVLIHDGARPFIREEELLDSVQAAEECGASCVAVPVKDTIKKAGQGDFVEETLERSALWSVQTPQTFRYALIQAAHRIAAEEGFTGTDDATLVERLGYPLKLVQGSYFNIKITTQEDLVLAEAIASKEYVLKGRMK